MATIEFRRRRSEDEMEPYYVRIAEAGDGRALAFTENSESWDEPERAIAVLRSGDVLVDRLYDRGNDCWFFRVKDPSGEVLFRGMPCATEEEMEATVSRLLGEAVTASVLDDAG